MALSMARDKLLPLLMEVANALRGIPREVAGIKEELERIQTSIDEVDRMDAAEQDNTQDGTKPRVRQLIEAAYRIEDVIDEYAIVEEQQPRDPGCGIVDHFIKTLILRLQIVHEIQDIKTRIPQINQSIEQGPSSSTGSQNVTWHNLRMAPLLDKGPEVVGFEAPKAKLTGWLVEGRAERTVISVVGMGGQGKTTLAKTVLDTEKGHFDCHAWITVSQSYSVKGLLRGLLEKFCKEKKEAPPNGISEMDRMTLITEVSNYLEEKRYVVLFDDVWDVHFWDDIEFAMPDNKNGSRILITTRNLDVAETCKKSSFLEVHKLQPLTQEKSIELFYKKAFRIDFGGCCPKELLHISSEIVEKCRGLPLAIVAIGSLLSSKEEKNSSDWERFSQNLSSELEKNSHLTEITKILRLSYDDLPYNLKSCLLYFGMYPEDHEVESVRLIRQWIAEGFVKYERGKTLEEVARQYLSELIHRNLVIVSSFSIDGKPKRCRVHDLLREVILKKIEDLSFSQFVSEDSQLAINGMIWHLTVATNSDDLLGTTKSSQIRSLHIFRGKELPEYFVRIITTTYKLLKVLDFEDAPLNYVPKDLGNLFHLRYLCFRKTNIEHLPSSVGNLQNLETLDLRQTLVREMPREINKLSKLRHLLANHTSWGFGHGIQMKDGIGNLVSLQTLRQVEIDHIGEEQIKELEQLTELRSLGLIHVKQEYGSTLCSSINKMHHLEKLHIDAINFNEVLDLHCISSLPALQKLRLRGKLDKLPNWISDLQNLVKLSLVSTKLTNDPLKSLKNMPNLLLLSLDSAYEDKSLHFEDGGFQKLKRLSLRHLYNLNSIRIVEGALPSLKEFMLVYIPLLHEVPAGIRHLPELEVFHIINMPEEFRDSIRGDRWINKHVSLVNIADSVRENYWDTETCIIRDSRC